VWSAGQPALDLIVTLDDATSAIYSAFLIEEEGTASTFRAADGGVWLSWPSMSLYTDGARIIFTRRRRAAKLIARDHAGRACIGASGVEHIAAYSPQARGRSERVFHTLQDRLVKELALKEIDTVEAANLFLRDVYIPNITPGSRSRLRRKARRLWRSLASTCGDFMRPESVRSATIIACRSTGSSCNTESPLRAHFVKTRVKVRQYQMEPMRFSTARCLGRYDKKGVLNEERKAA